jgi:glucokinase
MTTSHPSRPHSRSRPVTVGVDLGGTGTRIVVLESDGTVRDQRIIATPHDAAPAATHVIDLTKHICALAGDADLIAIGVGASGPIDATGVVRNTDTLRAFSGIPLAGLLAEELGVPCTLDNDTVAAAVGENTYGAGQGSRRLLMITLGTGIGACLLVEGKSFRGADGIHPEASHIPVPGPPAPCYCGLPTCWEQLASRRALDILTKNATSELATAATNGDPNAIEFLNRYGRYVGTGTGALITIFRPDRIVFGGSAARYLPLFALGLNEALIRRAPFALTPEYAEARLGALSGAIGAAVIARATALDHLT